MRRSRLGLHFSLPVLVLLAILWPAAAFQQPGVHPLTGRHIAGVCGAGPCATWLERPEREQEENPEGALDALNLKPGMVVADVGSGTGYMSLKLARRVGASGKVYAEDVQPDMLEKVRANAAKSGLKNIETVQGAYADPKLPAGQIDLVLLVDVYHEFSEPQKNAARHSRFAQAGWEIGSVGVPQGRPDDSNSAGAQNERGRGQNGARGGGFQARPGD